MNVGQVGVFVRRFCTHELSTYPFANKQIPFRESQAGYGRAIVVARRVRNRLTIMDNHQAFAMGIVR
jgi:hypothetical protein